MKTDACPKCGSTERERGEMFPKGHFTEIRFKSETSGLKELVAQGFERKKVVALACSSCGYIELFLADHDNPEAV
jgi:predicted nucleic-acid-binding Zn-ribbon protein